MLMGWGGQGDGNQQVGALLGSLEMLNPVFQASTCGLFASDVTVLEISACGFLPPAAIFFRQRGFLRGSAERKTRRKVGWWALPPRWFLAGLLAGILVQTSEAPAGTLG
jgi:hypothetical protein